jgi:sialic acid synthase SpsE/mannose-6-phosphate isomerase-like protein (cupin superfamily)
MKIPTDNLLFIFDMANNHMGNVEHGLKIMREIHEVTRHFSFHFACKFQYRDLETFIHPDFKLRTDSKYVKRFSETRLTKEQFKILKNELDNLEYISICTPFDEASVDLIEEHNFDIIKVGSCSFTDWPLLERIVKTNKPIIASTAGVPLENIDRVVSFFAHRQKDFALMHCVAEYPTENQNLQLNQIDLLRSRYPNVRIGYSTHENPDNVDTVKITIAKGATILEKHVGVATENISLNAYSATPNQIRLWLQSAQEALEMSGVSGRRSDFTEKEKADLCGLRRGVFARRRIRAGEKIGLADVFLAIPVNDGQITANDLSKYTEFYAQSDINGNAPMMFAGVRKVEIWEKVYSIVRRVKAFLKESGVAVPGAADLEISHHYGIDRFDEFGTTMITVVNREYCKKLIILLQGQKHPEQCHKQKEETFHILHGDVLINLDGVEKECYRGDVVVVERGTRHSFSSKTGAVLEEISSTHYKDDSYYIDPAITNNKNRKTLLTYWMD